VLAGCAAVGPSYTPTQPPLPAAWSRAGATPTDAAALAQWWRQLGDPVLGALIDEAMRANLDLETAAARLREARARAALAGAQRAPDVSGTASASAVRTEGQPTNQSYSLGIDASWEADLFGGKRRAVEAAAADTQAAALTLEAARVSLAAEVARTYVELRGFQTRADIARRNLESQSETLQISEWRAQAGLVGSLDVEQARANREQTRAQIPVLESSIAQSRHRIAILLGQPPAALDARLAATGALPTVNAALAAGIPADVLRQRPDVRAAERSVAAETARIGQAEAARYPSLTLSGSIGLDALRLGRLASAPLAGSLLAALTGSLFDGGRAAQQVEIQRAVQSRALVGYRAAVLTALEDVENALVALASARDRQSALAAALEAARNASLLAHHRYTGGLIDFQTVLDTDRSVLSLEDGLAASEADGVLAVVQLYKALGGGWSPAAPAATES
jgi:NodT family efflux transporter outer membrane factor (OMF) lipoprotein